MDDASPQCPEPVGEDPELSPDRAMVRQVVEQLPPEQRVVIELSYVQGLSSSEIAATMGSPLGTVKSRTAAALSKLRAAMSNASPAVGGRA